MVRFLGLAYVFVLSCAVAQVSAEVNLVSEPMVADDGYPVYRIPGFAQAADGSLLLFAEGRPSGSDPGGADDIDMVFKRSTDGGQTWSDLTVLHQRAGFDYSDPRVVIDEQTGDAHLLYVQWPTNNGQTGVPVGLGDESSVIFHQVSSDHGATWSGPSNINTQVKAPTWASLNTGPGLGIQLKWQDADPSRNGRLIVPGHHRPDAFRGVSLFSDDGGASWAHGSGSTPGHADESEVIELTNGDLLWDGRQAGGSTRNRFLSSDGGMTWSDAGAGDIAITPVDSALVRYSAKREGDDRDRILFSGPLGDPAGAGNNRTNIGVWTSYDEGETFINPVMIQPGSAAYSVIDTLEDGSIGLIYEVNHNTIRYVNFELSLLEGAAHHRQLTHYDGFDNEVARNRGGVGWSGAWQGDGTFTGAGDVAFEGLPFEQRKGRLDLVEGQSARRDLAAPIDLNANATTYISLLVSQNLDSSANGESEEFLDIELRDENQETRAAFGVGSNEAFFVNRLGDTVAGPPDTVKRHERYLLVAKIVGRDDSDRAHVDQLFLKVFVSGEDDIPADASQIEWTLVGSSNENSSAVLESIHLEGGNNVTWSLDELRIGDSFDAVAGASDIPEPASGMLLGGGLAAWLLRRH